MDEALAAFLAESHEALLRLETDLVDAERDPTDASRLASIFRAVHTIKGTCGFFGFPRLERLTHAAEDTLALLRDGRIALSLPLVDALMALVDGVRAMLGAIEDTGADGDEDHAALISVFERLAAGAAATPVAPAAAEPFAEEDVARLASADNTVRVGVALLDRLMNLVGELVLARNRLVQHASVLGDTQLARASGRLDAVTTELQEGLMKTRMQPISVLWASYPRLLRDLEQVTGKQVRLLREGEGTEVDRSLLQAIKDPLVHLIRNAVDHGLELPAARVAGGKAAQGTVRVRAFHENGYVIVEVADDGAGIDTAAVARRAVERGLVREDQADRLGERDVLAFLFQPGFSTARAVTTVSGRGVGLDVVRNNIEQVGGTVDIETWAGVGTTFRIKVPLTLAIIPALVIGCDHERFAVPQVNLIEIVRVEPDDIRFELLHGVPLFRLRGHLLPLVDLRAFLGLPPRHEGSAESRYVLVLEVDRRRYGLVVDLVHDAEEIVVKPLSRQLKSASCYAGATVMGDGRVALILDVKAIARLARVFEEGRRSTAIAPVADAAAASLDENASLVLFRLGESSRGALPLSSVSRLEKLPMSAVEHAAGREVVQYRGRILPLVRVARRLGIAGGEQTGDDGTLPVIVHHAAAGPVGLVVGEILDIVEQRLDVIQRADAIDGLLGSAIVQDCVTDIVDPERLLSPIAGELLRAPEQA